MARKIDLTKSPESHCPRFDSCGINKCPLHKDYEKLLNSPADPSAQKKEKCTSKNIRKEIGKAFTLKYGGLTTREFNGAKRWAEMSEDDKKVAMGRLQQISPITRLSAKGYTICPKKNINRETHRQEANNGVLERVNDSSEEGLE